MFGNGKHASLLRKNKNNETKKLRYCYLRAQKLILFVAYEEAK